MVPNDVPLIDSDFITSRLDSRERKKSPRAEKQVEKDRGWLLSCESFLRGYEEVFLEASHPRRQPLTVDDGEKKRNHNAKPFVWRREL